MIFRCLLGIFYSRIKELVRFSGVQGLSKMKNMTCDVTFPRQKDAVIVIIFFIHTISMSIFLGQSKRATKTTFSVSGYTSSVWSYQFAKKKWDTFLRLFLLLFFSVTMWACLSVRWSLQFRMISTDLLFVKVKKDFFLKNIYWPNENPPPPKKEDTKLAVTVVNKFSIITKYARSKQSLSRLILGEIQYSLMNRTDFC